MVEYATLQVHKDTKERIASIRRPGESFDAAVRRLLDDMQRWEEQEFLHELDAMYEDDDAFEPLA